MAHFEFEHPFMFLLLLLIICIYKCPLSIKKIIFPHIHLFGKFTNWVNIDKLLYSLVLALLVTALASPISYDAQLSSKRKGRDLVFVLDTSGSMAQSGYDKEQRTEQKFDILKQIISAFITNRFDDNVGVSVFGSYGFASVPLTYDMKAVAFLLDFLEVGIAGENTAIGDGIMSAVKLLKHSDAKNKVIILVTDGYQNSGQISVQQAVEEAKKAHITIYTIGIGTQKEFDAKLLQTIASQTNGKMFAADNKEKLQEVYQELDTLEPSTIRSQHYLNKQMLYSYPLAMAILILLYLLSRKRVF